MAHDVFVSYSSRDNETALAVVNALESNGIRCWIAPRDIKAGDVWAQAIVNAIGSARAFVLIFSSHANRSGHVVNELDAAIRKGSIVIPFRVENIMPEGAMEYHLRTRHWLDALTPNLTLHLKDLVTTIQNLLQIEPKPPTPATEYGTFGPPPTPTPSKARARVESTDTSFNLKVPKLRFRMTGRMWKAAAVVIAVLVVGLGVTKLFGGGELLHVEFEYRGQVDGKEWTVPLEISALHFFEGAGEAPPYGSPGRRYAGTFVASQTRFIHTEITLKLVPAGRIIIVPVTCTIYSSGGGVVGSFTIESTIQIGNASWINERRLGADRPGSWRSGKYRTDCKYGDKLVGRANFRVVD